MRGCNGTAVHGKIAVTLRCLILLALAAVVAPARLDAHPAPFSYLDVHVAADGLSGRLVVHTLDVAHELGLDAATLADAAVVDRHAAALSGLLASRLSFAGDSQFIRWTTIGAHPVPDQGAIALDWSAAVSRVPGRLGIRALLFPYDPNHQTFVNVYEKGVLTRQLVLNAGRSDADFFTGTRQGRLAVLRSFTASGIHHIAIGPDHILFIVGLLLLGGSLPRLLAIVTAFTIGHSATLALATLNIVDPPSRIVEPAIALSIVYVGADNLLVGARGRDVRAWVALAFGLIHGFGFASVLREAGLPDGALGLSLFSFNLGVEIGQAAIVVLVASALAAIRSRSDVAAHRLAIAGSLIVLATGAFWFVDRVL